MLMFGQCLLLQLLYVCLRHSWDCVTAFLETTQQTEAEAMLFHLGRSALKSDENQIIATAYNKEELKLVTQADLEIR